MATKLKVVTADSAPPQPPQPELPKTLRAAVDRTERELLMTMRSKVAVEIDAGVAPAYLAPLMRQLREIDKEIRLLDAREELQDDAADGAVPDETFDASTI